MNFFKFLEGEFLRKFYKCSFCFGFVGNLEILIYGLLEVFRQFFLCRLMLVKFFLLFLDFIRGLEEYNLFCQVIFMWVYC